MEQTSTLRIKIDLINFFHQKLKIDWKTLEDFKIKGLEFIESVKEKYKDDSITNEIYRTYLDELYSFIIPSSNFNALIMQGGGILGLAYVGVLEELKNYYSFNWYAGTSAGAIMAVLLGSGHTLEELRDILNTKNFNDFKDSSILKAYLYNIFRKGALYEADTFVEWLEELLASKLDSATSVELGELPIRTSVYASRKDLQSQIFDSHLENCKSTKVAFAARCSMSIPYIFTKQKIDGRNVVDGGINNNFPVEILLRDNPNTEFIGMYLGSPTYKHKKTRLLGDLIRIARNSRDSETLKKYKDKIIIIDTSPISFLKFNLNKVEKDFLVESGRLAAIYFLDKKKHLNKDDHDYNLRVKNLEIVRSTLKRRKRKVKKIIYSILIVLIIAISVNVVFY